MTRAILPGTLSAGMLLILALALLGGCQSPPRGPVPPQTNAALPQADAARLQQLLPTDLLLIGEQHDAPEHQALQRQTVQWLAERGQLAALALEMAEQGHHTRNLPPSASEEEVRAALGWKIDAWPWDNYGPAIMAAVRAGVPVLGANLPATRMREAMRDATLQTHLPTAALARQQQRIREGHCHALPESQIMPMTRVQIARDIAMANTLAQAASPGRVVVLIGGNGHMHRTLGVPRHLPANLRVRVLSAQVQQALPIRLSTSPQQDSDDENDATTADDLIWPTRPLPPHDHCAAFRQRARPLSKPATTSAADVAADNAAMPPTSGASDAAKAKHPAPDSVPPTRLGDAP